MKEQDIMDQLTDQEKLSDEMLDSDRPGGGVPFKDEGADHEGGFKISGKVDEGDLRDKLKRGYI